MPNLRPVVELSRSNSQLDELKDCAVPLLPEGVRIEDRRPIEEMTDRPAFLLLACCPECGEVYIFITSARDTCNYSTVCQRCTK